MSGTITILRAFMKSLPRNWQKPKLLLLKWLTLRPMRHRYEEDRSEKCWIWRQMVKRWPRGAAMAVIVDASSKAQAFRVTMEFALLSAHTIRLFQIFWQNCRAEGYGLALAAYWLTKR